VKAVNQTNTSHQEMAKHIEDLIQITLNTIEEQKRILTKDELGFLYKSALRLIMTIGFD